MKPESIHCEFCRVKIPEKVCELSTYRKVVDGKEYFFCCRKCAERYQQKSKK
jgi:YHS domain-containing protein